MYPKTITDIYLIYFVTICNKHSTKYIAPTYKITKVREPYSVVQFLAERLDIPPLIGLPASPEDDEVEN